MNISSTQTSQNASISFFSCFEVTGSPEFLKNFSPDIWTLKKSPSSLLPTKKNCSKRLRKKSKK